MSGNPTGKFPKTAHLLKRADFQRVYKQGKRHFSGNMTVFYLRESSDAKQVRVGFTVPRALGGSVDRNRIRRRLREAVRHHLAALQDGGGAIDVVFNPKRTVLEAEFEALSSEVERAFTVIRKNVTAAKRERETAG